MGNQIIWSVALLIGLINQAEIKAEETESPPELAKLKQQYKVAVQRATNPLLAKLKTTLSAYKIRSTKAGNLEDAVAAQSMLEKLDESGGLTESVALTSAPDELLDLVNNALSMQERIVSPLETKYVEALQSLKKWYMKSGKLEGALAVDATLKDFEREPSPIPEDNQFPDVLFGVRYQFIDSSKWIEIREGGKAATWDGLKSWEITGDDEITLGRGTRIVRKEDGTLIAFNYKGDQVLFQPAD